MNGLATSPKVTVLMPVYNAASFVASALESILSQTYRDFEFLIIDDGSNDRSVDIINSYNDPRIKLYINHKNLGVTRTLNRGFDLSCGEYIVRMDADDISLPTRLERQVAFMDMNPQVGVCGSWVEAFGESTGIWKYPEEPEDVHSHLLFHCAVAHPSACLRHHAFAEKELRYNEKYLHAEDYQLWQRASEHFQIANIGEVLLMYRVHAISISRSNKRIQAETLRQIDQEALKVLGIDASGYELDLHRAIGNGVFDAFSLDEVSMWLQKILSENERGQRYSKKALQRYCGQLWFQACNTKLCHGNARYLRSPLWMYVDFRRKLHLLMLYCRARYM